jgi:hypothetical protein
MAINEYFTPAQYTPMDVYAPPIGLGEGSLGATKSPAAPRAATGEAETPLERGFFGHTYGVEPHLTTGSYDEWQQASQDFQKEVNELSKVVVNTKPGTPEFESAKMRIGELQQKRGQLDDKEHLVREENKVLATIEKERAKLMSIPIERRGHLATQLERAIQDIKQNKTSPLVYKDLVEGMVDMEKYRDYEGQIQDYVGKLKGQQKSELQSILGEYIVGQTSSGVTGKRINDLVNSVFNTKSEMGMDLIADLSYYFYQTPKGAAELKERGAIDEEGNLDSEKAKNIISQEYTDTVANYLKGALAHRNWEEGKTIKTNQAHFKNLEREAESILNPFSTKNEQEITLKSLNTKINESLDNRKSLQEELNKATGEYDKRLIENQIANIDNIVAALKNNQEDLLKQNLREDEYKELKDLEEFLLLTTQSYNSWKDTDKGSALEGLLGQTGLLPFVLNYSEAAEMGEDYFLQAVRNDKDSKTASWFNNLGNLIVKAGAEFSYSAIEAVVGGFKLAHPLNPGAYIDAAKNIDMAEYRLKRAANLAQSYSQFAEPEELLSLYNRGLKGDEDKTVHSSYTSYSLPTKGVDNKKLAFEKNLLNNLNLNTIQFGERGGNIVTADAALGYIKDPKIDQSRTKAAITTRPDASGKYYIEITTHLKSGIEGKESSKPRNPVLLALEPSVYNQLVDNFVKNAPNTRSREYTDMAHKLLNTSSYLNFEEEWNRNTRNIEAGVRGTLYSKGITASDLYNISPDKMATFNESAESLKVVVEQSGENVYNIDTGLGVSIHVSRLEDVKKISQNVLVTYDTGILNILKAAPKPKEGTVKGYLLEGLKNSDNLNKDTKEAIVQVSIDLENLGFTEEQQIEAIYRMIKQIQ